MRRTLSLFIGIVLTLATVGIVMLASASSTKYDNAASYFVLHQIVWAVLALIVATVASQFDYHYYQRLVIPAAALSVLLLILVRIPGIGTYINGSWRWLRLGPITVQPSEIAKIASIMLFSWWLSRNQRRIDEFRRGILIPFAMLGCIVVPILLEPDFGTTMLISLVSISMMFLGGVSILPLLSLGLAGLLAVALIIFQNPERMSRIFAFLDPQKYEQDKAWQLINSLRAFANGGMNGWWKGQGYGNSMQKYNYLPEAHTDFIFPIIGEELGLLAALCIFSLYFFLFLLGLRIAISARDDFGRFLAYGITLMITLQALLNFAVVTGCVPTKGLALPFISYGGSSLVISGLMVGILINIARSALHPPTAANRNPFKDRSRKA
jgi:cell division protein FtsW